MSVIQIREAQREGARLVVGIAGISGSGKTYTALLLAWGLANYNSKKIGFLDTENRRGSLYADALKDEHGNVHRFLIADLEPPFSPERYKKAILEFQAAGVEVLVIDSTTHEWEGQGGCEDIANVNPRMKDWKTAKGEHKSYMNTMLQCNMHIIASVRAREKVSIEKVEGKTVVTSLGVLPVCEKNFMFEMTASLMMWNEGRAQEVLKCPEDLRPILGREKGYITAADGKALRDWVDGAKHLDAKVEQARNTLRTTTEQGLAALQAAWAALPAKIKKAIGPHGCPEDLKQSAIAFDKQRAANNPNQDADAINAKLAQQQAGAESPA